MTDRIGNTPRRGENPRNGERPRSGERPQNGERLLSVRELCISIGGRHIVDRVSFDIDKGSCLAIVGESGSGKTLTALSLVGLLPKGGRASGEARLFCDGGEKELISLGEKDLRSVRGGKIGTVFQNPASALTPTMRIGAMFRETLRRHGGYTPRQIRTLTEKSLAGVGIPADGITRYPHAFSGGQRQRIAIALATVCSPDLLIADEPTTALDVLAQKRVTDIFKGLINDGASVLMISHNLALCYGLCDSICVMYAGQVMERGRAELIFSRPLHPYTRALLKCVPDPASEKRLYEIPPPRHPWDGVGCPFEPRCPHAGSGCRREIPERQVDHRAVRCIAAE